MAFPTNTIRLDAARAIFTNVDFSEIIVSGVRVGYRAKTEGATLENTSLTALCRALWEG
jgi:uncharacterized protein YjbI with pentapeptide repeats